MNPVDNRSVKIPYIFTVSFFRKQTLKAMHYKKKLTPALKGILNIPQLKFFSHYVDIHKLTAYA